MAKLALICLTAILIGFAKYIAGPVILKGMDIDFAQSMMGARILPQAKPGPTRVKLASLATRLALAREARSAFYAPSPFPVAGGVDPGPQTLPPPDLPPEPDIEPVQ